MTATGQNTKDTTAGVVIFDPTTFGAGSALDEQVTVRAVHLFSIVRTAVVHGTLAANDVIETAWGVGIVTVGAPLPDPLLSDAYSQRFDWMALGPIYTFSDGADHTYFDFPSQHSDDSTATEVRIRAQRKVLEDQRVYFMYRTKGTAEGGGTMTSATSQLIVETSTLVQRTMRRR